MPGCRAPNCGVAACCSLRVPGSLVQLAALYGSHAVKAEPVTLARAAGAGARVGHILWGESQPGAGDVLRPGTDCHRCQGEWHMVVLGQGQLGGKTLPCALTPLPVWRLSRAAPMSRVLAPHCCPWVSPRPPLLLPPFPCGHHTVDAQPWLQAGSLCLDTRGSMSLTCALVSPGNGCPAMPCHARLEQHPVCRGRALSCLCRAAAVQVAGLSCATAGCELPAKRAAGTSSRAALPRAGAGTAGPSHTSCRRAGMG